MTLRRTLVASVAAASVVLASCGSQDAEEAATTASEAVESATEAASEAAHDHHHLTIEDNFGTHELHTPYDRVAVTDNRSFEILADWGVNIVAAPLGLVPDTLSDKLNESTVEANLGMHREPDLEALVAAEPELVINGQRFQQYQDDIEQLVGSDVPVLDFEPRDDKPLFEELVRQVEALGKIFDHEDEADALIEDFNKALDRAKAAYDPSKTVMAVNTSGGDIGYIAPGQGRFFGAFFDALGLEPALVVQNASSDHKGDDISVEAIAESNPDWIFVLDRDGAIGADEGTLHGEALIRDNAALQGLGAVSNDKIIVAPADTYTNENIITYTEVLNAIADAFEADKS